MDFPWGPRKVIYGLLGTITLVVVLELGLLGLLMALGYETESKDVGDIFSKAEAVAIYADKKLATINETGTTQNLVPPVIQASVPTLRLYLGRLLVLQVAIISFVVILIGLRPNALLAKLKVTNLTITTLVMPIIAVISCYLVLALYISLISKLNISILEPNSTVPTEILRDTWAIILAGIGIIVLAPIAEELLYRGLIFGGLAKWGFWPAAIISGVIFSAVHLDIGSLIPFFIIGIVLAWLFWRRGRLVESIIFHALFNATSFTLLVTRG